VVWEHVTPGDRGMPIPTTPVLMRLSDPRVQQFWDPHRMLSGLIAHSLPRDTLSRMAEIDSTGRTVVWDCVAAFHAGVRWDAGFPIPDWAGRPLADAADSLGRWLASAADTTSARSHRGTLP
jgi:hypothetical protein